MFKQLRFVSTLLVGVIISTATQAQPLMPLLKGSQLSRVKDLGYPDFRQFVDVNNDKQTDFCRFVGNAPGTFLSCQLGTKQGVFDSATPYGFNASPGTNLGSAPRLIFPVGGVQPAFCRYLAVPKRAIAPATASAKTAATPPTAPAPAAPDGSDKHMPNPHFVPLPALDVTQKLSCIQAMKGGFDPSKEINPSDRGDKKKVALVSAEDGSTIEIVYGGAGGWIASMTDANGRSYRLTQTSTVSSNSFFYTTYLKLTSDRDDSGKVFSAATLKINPRANILFDQFFQIGRNGSLNFSAAGTGSQGYTMLSTGNVKGSQVMVWDGCQVADPNSRGTPYYGTLDANGRVDWNGPKPPQTVSSCVPAALSKIQNFSQVFTVLAAKSKDVLRTGNPSIDNKDLSSLTASDIQVIVSLLKQKIAGTSDPSEKEQLSDTVGFMNGLKGWVLGVGTSGILRGLGTMVSGTTMLVGSIAFLVLGEVTIYIIQDYQGTMAQQDCIAAYIKTNTQTDDCKKLIVIKDSTNPNL